MSVTYRYIVRYILDGLCPDKWDEFYTFESPSLFEGEELLREADARRVWWENSGNGNYRIISVVTQRVTTEDLDVLYVQETKENDP
jgi:hypothetical protein